jgi:hypothetical protein
MGSLKNSTRKTYFMLTVSKNTFWCRAQTKVKEITKTSDPLSNRTFDKGRRENPVLDQNYLYDVIMI